MKKMLLIVNPSAGRGVMENHLMQCIVLLQKAGYDVTVHMTEQPHDATKMVIERAAEFDRIVCAGGDGTLNEVVTGLMESDVRPALGYIPAGTTNDFANSLEIPKQPIQAAEIAAGNALHALDVGRFNDQYFNYVAAFGVFTEVSYATPQQSKNIFGRTAYIFEGMKSLINIKDYHISVKCNEMELDDEFVFGMVSNSVSVGGFKQIASDDVKLDDGLYEVLLVYPVEGPMELQWLINDLLTNNTDSTRYAYFTTSHIIFESDTEVPWTLDGEFGGQVKQAEITNNPRAITFVVGE